MFAFPRGEQTPGSSTYKASTEPVSGMQREGLVDKELEIGLPEGRNKEFSRDGRGISIDSCREAR